MIRIEVDLEDEASRNLWKALGELVEYLPGEWVLIGGLMVQLHVLEHGIRHVRFTRDIDVLAPDGLRPAPSLSSGLRLLESRAGRRR
jgi:hypothetical protein